MQCKECNEESSALSLAVGVCFFFTLAAMAARLTRAHLLLTALLLSAHLFHTEARLAAQGRHHARGGQGRVEAGPETDADTLPDAWDRRRLLQGAAAMCPPAAGRHAPTTPLSSLTPPSPTTGAPPYPPSLGAGGIAGIAVGAVALVAIAGLVGRAVVKSKKAKRPAAQRTLEGSVDTAAAKFVADKPGLSAEERAAAKGRYREARAGLRLVGERRQLHRRRRAPGIHSRGLGAHGHPRRGAGHPRV